MTERDQPSIQEPSPGRPSRRRFFAGLGAAGLSGAGVGLGAGEVLRPLLPDRGDTAAEARLRMAQERAEADAAPQPGIAGRAPAFTHVISLDLADGVRDAADSARIGAAETLRTWTDLAARLHEQGPTGVVENAASADLLPASLMVTVGVGSSLLTAIDADDRRPDAFADLPAFATDELRPQWCGGDLLLQVGAEDPMVLAAAVTELVDATAATATVRWSVRGFRRTAAAAADPDTTPRNLMGQRDGTANPPLDHALFQRTVTATPDEDPAQAWMAGGSYLVARRIRMLLDDWRELDETAQSRVIGRHISSGAPLGAKHESDDVPLTARDSTGALVVPEDSHVRLSGPELNLGARMFRRGYSYDEGWRADGVRDAGLLFMAWQGDPRTGFTPVQRTLADQGDALNRFIRHEGSALFAVPAAQDGQYLGQDLVEG